MLALTEMVRSCQKRGVHMYTQQNQPSSGCIGMQHSSSSGRSNGQRVSLSLVSKADDRHLCLQQGQELLKPSESEGNEYGVCGAKETSNIAGFGCVSHSLSASRLRSLNFFAMSNCNNCKKEPPSTAGNEVIEIDHQQKA